jgi:hypothetical protein
MIAAGEDSYFVMPMGDIYAVQWAERCKAFRVDAIERLSGCRAPAARMRA